MDGFTLSIADTTLQLFAERCLYWPSEKTLVVADLHWGKTATFRKFGLPIPEVITNDLARISSAISHTSAETLLILGDLVHGCHWEDPILHKAITCWREKHSNLSIHLVAGNHDRLPHGLPDNWQITIHPHQLKQGPFCFQHHPQPCDRHFVLAGHWHPKFHLTGKGLGSHKLPGFLFKDEFAVLPAFSEFIDSKVIKPLPSDRVYLIVDGRIVDASQLAPLKPLNNKK